MVGTTVEGPIEPRVVRDAHRLLDEAGRIGDDGDLVVGNAERLRLYYLAALRAAGAVLVVLESRHRGPRGQRSAWVRLAAQGRVVGDDSGLAQVAAFFAGHSVLRQRIETGLVAEVDQAVVADMRVHLAAFVAVAETILLDYEQGRTVPRVGVQRRSA